MNIRKSTHSNKKLHRFIAFMLVLILLLVCTNLAIAYVHDYYHANPYAKENLHSDSLVNITEEKDYIVFSPQDPQKAIIFYPGGKVEYTAYAPLMHTLAKNGFLCILIHMPANLAVLDINAANDAKYQCSINYPTVTDWYMAGHSLGGAMAAQYISKHVSEFDGLILLGAYSTVDLSQSSLPVLSIYGSADGVLNKEKYIKYKKNLPSDYEEQIIEGGCHAYFGSYGFQKNDGTPSITNQEQIQSTTDYICYKYLSSKS